MKALVIPAIDGCNCPACCDYKRGLIKGMDRVAGDTLYEQAGVEVMGLMMELDAVLEKYRETPPIRAYTTLIKTVLARVGRIPPQMVGEFRLLGFDTRDDVSALQLLVDMTLFILMGGTDEERAGLLNRARDWWVDTPPVEYLLTAFLD